jgi:hypothetical protein
MTVPPNHPSWNKAASVTTLFEYFQKALKHYARDATADIADALDARAPSMVIEDPSRMKCITTIETNQEDVLHLYWEYAYDTVICTIVGGLDKSKKVTHTFKAEDGDIDRVMAQLVSREFGI